jgi:distribution and morphology protein 12
MSFDIFWDKLDKQVAQKVQDIINEQFRTSNNKPSFIGDIEISEFDFGTVPPSIEIIDITDPFPEFYLPDNTVVDVDIKSDSLESNGNVNGVGSGNSNIGVGIGGERGRTRESVINSEQRMFHNNTTSSSFTRSNTLNNNNNNNRSPSFTPIITPLSSSIVSDSSVDYLNYQRQQQRLREQTRNDGIPLHLRGDYNPQIDDHIQYEPSNSEGEEVPLKQDTDAQIHIAVSYKGNMKMVISTELYMNYPSLMFMSLPVRLTITGFEFSGDYSFLKLFVIFIKKNFY